MRASIRFLLGAVCAMLAGRLVAAPAGDPDSVNPGGSPTVDEPLGDSPQAWSLHGQFTNVVQYHPAFRSPYRGANSLDASNSGRETVDLTLYAGLRLWGGAAIYANPEVDQGFGLSTTLGLGGFSSGEAYKVGSSDPYYRTPRLFLRQIIDLGGEAVGVAPGANQIAGMQPSNNVTVTVGKFSAVDVFDTNRYAHDPRADFMNWAMIESVAYDYAADAWGYSYGTAAEWNQSWWTLRGGVFAMSRIPNQRELDRTFQQFELAAEVEQRHTWFDRLGKLKLLAFNNRGRMGTYDDALKLALPNGAIPDTSLVRRMASRPGVAVNFEQELGANLGVFVRASWNDGSKEAFDFTEVNRSLSAGASLTGGRWNRSEDTVGIAAAVNGMSSAGRRYFGAGGLGILIGDGRLPDYGLEKIVETYYAAHLTGHLTISGDFQYIVNPAYNRDRGPVSIFGFRLHAEI